MDRSKFLVIPSAASFLIAAGCHEVAGLAIKQSLEPPVRPSATAGPPPPAGYSLSSAGGSRTELARNNYPYDTWIVINPDGTTFRLTAYGNAKPVSGDVGIGGVSGGRNGCDFHASVSFGQAVSSFGDCGSISGHPDTVLAKGQGFIYRGSFPLDYQTPDLYDCDPQLYSVCHVQEVKDMTFTVTVIPVVMKQVTANPHVVNFKALPYQQVTFTTGPDPATYMIGGAVKQMPLTTTSWVYTAADGTLDGNMCNGGFPILSCSPYLHKSGRMVVKAFTGGWEQTRTVTVQCLVTPADPILNDSTSDFTLREKIREMLDLSNADSSASQGFDVSHPGWSGGWIHETAFNIWKSTGGEIKFEVADPVYYSDACKVSYGVSPPALGDSLLGVGHTHVTYQGDPLYCNRNTTKNGVPVPMQRYPGDPNGVYVLNGPDSVAADDADRSSANTLQVPQYVMTASGYLLKIDPVANLSSPSPQTWYRVFGGTASQKKCSWPKKYKP